MIKHRPILIVILICLSACQSAPTATPSIPTDAPAALPLSTPTTTLTPICDDCITVSGMRIYPGQFTLAGKSTLPDGTCLHTQLFVQGESLSWWPADACVIVQDGAWQNSVSLEESGVPYGRPPEGGYTLVASREDRPIASAVFWIEYSGPPTPSPTLPTPPPTATAVPSHTPVEIDGRDFDWSPDGQAVVMTGFAEPRRIWIAREPDFAAEPLTSQVGHHPRWSPGGKYIAFVGPRESDEGETVWLIHADGSNLRDLLPDQEATHPTGKSIERWLDDHTVIFSDNCGTGCRRPATLDIYTRRVEAYPEGGQRYHWTAKGDAYVSVAGGGVPEIGLWQQADRGAWQETPLPRPAEFHSWSPDGQAFLFSHWSWAEGRGAPYAVTSHVPTLALWDVAHGQALDLVAGGYHGAWSPDGERIAFFLLGNPVYGAGGQVICTDLVPGQPFALLLAIWDVASAQVVSIIPILDSFDPSAYEEIGVGADFAAHQPLWSPDGRWLAYWEAGYDQQAWYDDAGGDLWLVDRNGTRQQRLTEGQGATQAMWSPDGTRLAYVAQRQSYVVAIPSLEAHTVQPAQAVRPTVPAGCIVRDADSQPFFYARDGYCLRYPSGFDVNERSAPDMIYVVGPERLTGPDPLSAKLGIRVEKHWKPRTLIEVADDYERGLRAFAPPRAVFTRTLTTLGGVSAVWIEGPGKAEWESEYTTQRCLLTLHESKAYILRFFPDPGAFPEIADDMQALQQVATNSFSFLPEGFPEIELPTGEDPDTAPLLSQREILRAWAIPRLVFGRADHSLWASALDGGDPWPLTDPLPGATDALQWSLSPDGRRIAVVQSTGFRREGQLPGGTLSLIDLATGKQEIVLRSLLPPNDGWRSLPDDADRAVLGGNRPVWSPDGAHVAFVSAHKGSADLYAYALASGEVRGVAAGDPNAAWPRWSPDGSHIVYTAVAYFGTGAGPNTQGLWVVPSDGRTDPRQLTAGGRQDQQLVAWLDTAQILVTSYSLMGERDLEAIAIESGARTSLVEGELAGLAWSGAAGLAAVSPGEENGALPPGLYLMDPEQPGSLLQIADQTVRNPRWSPGGRYLTYTTGDDCTLYDRELGTARLVRGEDALPAVFDSLSRRPSLSEFLSEWLGLTPEEQREPLPGRDNTLSKGLEYARRAGLVGELTFVTIAKMDYLQYRSLIEGPGTRLSGAGSRIDKQLWVLGFRGKIVSHLPGAAGEQYHYLLIALDAQTGDELSLTAYPPGQEPNFQGEQLILADGARFPIGSKDTALP